MTVLCIEEAPTDADELADARRRSASLVQVRHNEAGFRRGRYKSAFSSREVRSVLIARLSKHIATTIAVVQAQPRAGSRACFFFFFSFSLLLSISSSILTFIIFINRALFVKTCTFTRVYTSVGAVTVMLQRGATVSRDAKVGTEGQAGKLERGNDSARARARSLRLSLCRSIDG